MSPMLRVKPYRWPREGRWSVILLFGLMLLAVALEVLA
jgi:hypothetical protein